MKDKRIIIPFLGKDTLFSRTYVNYNVKKSIKGLRVYEPVL
jgi:hypothetical protein